MTAFNRPPSGNPHRSAFLGLLRRLVRRRAFQLVLRSALVLVSAGSVLLLTVETAAAAAVPAPAWGIETIARPSSFSAEDITLPSVGLRIAATGGTFRFEVKGAETPPLPWNASAAELEAAISALPTIGVGGSAIVTGGPGDELGTHPYEIAFRNTGLEFEGSEAVVGVSEALTGPSHRATLESGAREGTKDNFQIVLKNLGSVASSGPITLTDTLPPGLHVFHISSFAWACSVETVSGAEEITCTSNQSVGPLSSGPIESALQGIEVQVTLAPGATGTLTNVVEVSGGEAPVPAVAKTEVPIDAPPPFGLYGPFDASLLDPAGNNDVTAADHPDAAYSAFTLPSAISVEHRSQPNANPVETVKQIVVDLPPGVIGDARAAPTCPALSVTTLVFTPESCPASSRVGTLSLIQFLTEGGTEPDLPIYNVPPEPGYPAEFAVFETNLKRAEYLYASVVGSGPNAHVRITSGPQNVLGFELGFSLVFFGHPSVIDNTPPEQHAFFTAPSDCTASGFTTTIHVDSWKNPGPIEPDGHPNFSDPRWKSASSQAPPVTGCERLQFKPQASFKPEVTSSDSTTGLAVNIHIPQNEDPYGLATPPLRDATVALPKGLAVNPSSADGLAGCTPAQIGVANNDPGACPLASQIGGIAIGTPLLDHPLPGKVFLGTPECAPCTNADAQAGKLVKLYIEVNDPVSGVIVKLPGSGSLDPATGQITASFKENPQLPFEDLNLTFKGGPRATLTTPPTCGHYTTTTDLKPWSAPQSGPDPTPQSSFDLSSGPNGSACAANEAQQPNKPSFEAGTTTPIAGAYSPFVLKLSREDGSQRISSIDTTLPQGLLGKLAGIPYCSDAAIAASAAKSGNAEKATPSCPLASEVGVVNVGAGSGTPFYVQGHAYLAGPYKGAPLSLAIITPAVAGPFDLGTVVVKTALYVNETTAQIHAVSDPIPSILAGIPLDVRSIALNMDRPNFTLNPTSCDAMQVLGSATSTLGNVAPLQNRFQVGACGALGFKPKLALSLKGATKRSGHPALKAVVTYPKGSYANIAKAAVTLPASEFIDNARIGNVCTRPQFAEGKCPPSSVLGKATAYTPLLDKPLTGKVYFRANGGERELPDIVADLNGQIHVVLVGAVDAVHKKGSEVSRVRNTFATVPDAPVSKFVLQLKGGKQGLLVNSGNLCKVPNRAVVKLTAQNGKVYDTNRAVANSCGKGKKSRRGTSHR